MVLDVVIQVVIVFVGFFLQGVVLVREVFQVVVRTVNVLQFVVNYVFVWIVVLFIVDRYSVMCYFLYYRVVLFLGRVRRVIVIVFSVVLLIGIFFYWWLDVWRDIDFFSTLDKVFKWVYCFIVYFIFCGVFLVVNSVIICRLRRRGQSGLRFRVGKSIVIFLGIITFFVFFWVFRIFVMFYYLYVVFVYRDWRVYLVLDVVNMVVMFNIVVNFGFYCFVSKIFRVIVREVIQDVRLVCTLGVRLEDMVVEFVLKFLEFFKGVELQRRGLVGEFGVVQGSMCWGICVCVYKILLIFYLLFGGGERGFFFWGWFLRQRGG